ncbi:MAG: PEP-CTERM sorting domain-containing protein [Phycisphaerae bacterium]
MKAIGFAGLVALLLASSVMGASAVIWHARAVAFDGDGNPIDMGAPINPADYPTGVWLQWDVYCDVTGDNQGLFGAVVSMGVQNVATGAWAPVPQLDENLYQPAVYKAPGTAVNGSVADPAGAGGAGAGRGAAKGWPDIYGRFYIDQMGMGYLEWNARRYKTTIPKGWIGDQQWGVGRADRKAAILRDGPDGYYDLAEGVIEITSLPAGTYKSVFDMPVITSSVIDLGTNLNTDQPALPATAVTTHGGTSGNDWLLAGNYFQFTIVPEPATLLLLAGAALLYRRRHA